MGINEIVFPALFFSHDKTVYAMSTVDALKTSLERTVKSGYFNNLIIIDSSGKKYIIEKAIILHGIGPFWGYRDIFLNRLVRIEVNFKEFSEEVSSEEIKKLFSKASRTLFSGGDSRENAAFSKAVNQTMSSVETVKCIINWLWKELAER